MVSGALAIVLLLIARAPSIDRAAQLIEQQLRYKDGIELIERTLRDEELDDRDRVEAHRLLAIAYVARGAMGSATASFSRLLEIDPHYQLDPLASPKIQEAFDKAKAGQKPLPEPPPPAPPAEPLPRAEAPPKPEVSIAPPRPIEPAPAGEPITSRWWFWTIVAVAAGAGAGGAILLSNRDAPLPRGTLDPIQLD